MRRVIWSESGQDDLRRIDQYLREFDVDVAARVLRSIRSRLLLLQDYPFAGPEIDSDGRSMVVRGTPYVLVYAVVENEIAVLRIRDAREDWRPE